MKTRTLSFILLLPFLVACHSANAPTPAKDVFSIYLVKDSNQSYTAQKPALHEFVLEDTPILDINSITSYTWQNHLINFPTTTKEQLKSREPLIHYLFVVVANDQRVYWGMFLDGVDSYSCQNPVIDLLPRKPGASCIPDAFYITRAYPEYLGHPSETDLRNDQRIYNALKAAGKLAI